MRVIVAELRSRLVEFSSPPYLLIRVLRGGTLHISASERDTGVPCRVAHGVTKAEGTG